MGAEENGGANGDSGGGGGGCHNAVLGRANVLARERAARDDVGLMMDLRTHDGKTSGAARREAKGGRRTSDCATAPCGREAVVRGMGEGTRWGSTT
jgi:hypothetical protein